MRRLIGGLSVIGGRGWHSSKSSVLHPSSEDNVEVKGWVDGITVDAVALKQIQNLSKMKQVIRDPVAIMPDVHGGVGCTVGTVIPTSGALIPASVGVDIGCGMIAVKTSLMEEQLPSSLDRIQLAIEAAVPHGRTHSGRRKVDAGSWCADIPERVQRVWKEELHLGFEQLCRRTPSLEQSNYITHLGTLGSGNHFVEVCLDNDPHQKHMWVMLHSGSRGVGNRIGSTYIELAKKDMGNLIHDLPDKDLAYLQEGTQHFKEYVEAVEWAQDFALWNRRLMMEITLQAIRSVLPESAQFTVDKATAVNCHHNYVERFTVADDRVVWLTRKGATSAKEGELAVIPGSMGACSYIVRGKGNTESYCSCSHGAGRLYSRGEAKRRFTLADHIEATSGVACRKDEGVLDETPGAYKNIDIVMKAQEDLVEVVAVLRQVVCVKG
ncbi:tRNA-splicing ligase RtcB [Angomonas deanei]|nr:tRNA-splicing ligase RtcB [Angomonas deanei]|eukprot:EPY42863.1 tRNA-splicing ligase RtcB [Angomonas deanei]